jgi:sugar (pentulose or hexulose) kinase
LNKSPHSLLLDFGASRIKSVLLNRETGHFSHLQSEEALPRLEGKAGQYEVSALEFSKKFKELCISYIEKYELLIDQVLICSEMHGFILTDEKYNLLSNYISWKDERSLEHLDGMSTLDKISLDLGREFQTITGMKLRPSLPFLNAVHTFKKNNFPKKCFILSLPEWLSVSSCEDYNPIVHESMLAGLGVYDLKAKKESDLLLNYFKDQTGAILKVHDVVQDIKKTGDIRINNKKIGVYVGVGDHPCAVLGAGNTKKTISVNIGTGSQVAFIDFPTESISAEYRPYFNGSRLTTITHIPAGRVLNTYIGFLNQTLKVLGQSDYSFFKLLETLTLEEIESETLDIGLSIFPGSWNYSTGGFVGRISEKNLTPRNFLAGILKSLSNQYLEIIKNLDPNHLISEIILGGGVSQKLPILQKIFELKAVRRVKQNFSHPDETLLGLKLLVKQIQ